MLEKTISNKWEEQIRGRQLSERQFHMLGLFLVLLLFVPSFLLQEGSVVLVGDQLDGEIFTYLYGAKYLFSGKERIVEYMGGVPKSGLFPPSLFTVLLYRVTKPFTAFLINQLLTAVTAFLGMYALLKKISCSRWAAFFTAVVFASLPFYSVYGLSIAGLPMLLWAFSRLKEDAEKEEKEKRSPYGVFPLLLICLYGVFSSFVLIGYAVTGCLWLYGMGLLCTKKRKRYGRIYAGIFLLTALYLTINYELVAQVIGIGETQIGHKSEYVLHALPFFRTAWKLFVHGSGHAPSYHAWMIVPAVLMLIMGAFFYRDFQKAQKKQYVMLLLCFTAAVAIALFYGMFHAQWCVRIRQELGGFFIYFQMDRIYWFYPVLWYVILGMMLGLAPAFLGKICKWGKNQICTAILYALLIGIAAGCVLWNSDFKKNLRQLISPSTSNAVTWERYYGREIFSRIASFIKKGQSEYRVASVGLNPAVAAYNGFYTVDGYSNNYELSYKHDFREVIAGELEKDEALRSYFDDWGNRCYLFSAELGTEYYFEKDSGVSIKELSVDTQKLRELGCEYVFAGVPVENAEELGWTLEESFEAEVTDCRYCIRVYRITE